MKSATIISCVSLVLSAITGISSFIVFLKHDNRIKEQEKQLNKKLAVIYDSQIEKIRIEEENQNMAELSVKSLPYIGNGNYTVRITNIGKNKAQNIRLGENTLTFNNGIIDCSFKPINGLEPMSNVDFRLMCASGLVTNHYLTLIWDDGKNENKSKEFSINL